VFAQIDLDAYNVLLPFGSLAGLRQVALYLRDYINHIMIRMRMIFNGDVPIDATLYFLYLKLRSKLCLMFLY
jgi:hypothetical protein